MTNKKQKSISKRLSYWLRHKPEQIGIEILDNGWTDVEVLIQKANETFGGDQELNFEDIKYVVDNQLPEKRRLDFNEDLTQIRANQGHSINIKMNFLEVKPPVILYHGAPVGVIDQIMKEGLKKMSRHHVHLSVDKDTAAKVGSRRGKFEILEVEAMRMRADGHTIYISDNGVYLTDEVPPEYIIRN